jgi:hypothetical protein
VLLLGSFEIGKYESPALCFFKIVLDTLKSLYCLMNFKIGLLISEKKKKTQAGILITIM